MLAPRRGDEDSNRTDDIQTLGNDHYRVLGSSSLRVLAKRLEVDQPDESIATVAGYIQRHNERLPRTGDTAPFDRFQLVVTDQIDNETWIEVRGVGQTPEGPAENRS